MDAQSALRGIGPYSRAFGVLSASGRLICWRRSLLFMPPRLRWVIMDKKSSALNPSESKDPFLRHTNQSVWAADTRVETIAPLNEDKNCDVCIIGAGIAGLTIANLLARQGKSVVVLDKNGIGHGETLKTSAHLTNAIDSGYHQLRRYHGERGARLAAESHTAAIATIQRIVEEEKIDCDFKRLDGYLWILAILRRFWRRSLRPRAVRAST